ncbi:MAG: choice-of-anchor tandem repeat GloVer-containing protein [Candidatus Sulfotelmatobacter sp.]|jgi:uncharacterized repeat protein (TIGR03803 family)
MPRKFTAYFAATFAAALFALIFAATASAAEKPKTLHDFAVKGNDGSTVYSTLTLDAAGNLYGTTVDGGRYNSGIVFELSPTQSGLWNETILYNFKGGGGDGANPHSAPVFDSAGNLYGSTVGGGLNAKLCNSGCGVVYKLAPSGNGAWTETILHEFTGGTDGGVAYAGVVLDGAGNIYGANEIGGTSGNGVFYELSATSGSWQEVVFHNFGGKPDVADAYATPAFDAGNIYGTSYGGGAHGQGAVYELSQSNGSWTEQVLYSFKGGNDGAEPFAPVIFDQAGNIYGTTAEGGTESVGTAFELLVAQGWKKVILHQFLGLESGDGANPNGLVFDAKGNLYGTTVGGGTDNPGTIFKLTPTSHGWKETILYNFTGGNDGAYPSASPTLDSAGNLFGTTLWGGPAGDTVGGVAFELALQ